MNNNDNELYNDTELHDALARAVACENPDTSCKEAIDIRIAYANETKKGIIPMKNKMTKIAAAAAACVLLSTVTVFATGHIAYTVSHSSGIPEYTAYADLEKAEARAGLELPIPEEFENGYRFDSLNISESSDVDEDGVNVNSYKGIDAKYKKEGLPDVYISADPELGIDRFDESKANMSRAVEGITLYYSEDEYLFLPPDKEASAEELTREESDPHFYISYGSSERETRIIKSVIFSKDGTIYDIMTFDSSLTADEMFDMAEEMLK